MKLQNFLGTDEKWNFEAVAEDSELTYQIQTLLIGLSLLEPPADAKFGPLTANAIRKFQRINEIETDYIGAITAKELIETKPEELPKPELKLGNNIASTIIRYMLAKDYKVFTDPKEYNIVYIEGMGLDLTLNNDAPNEFNDCRIVIEFINGVPGIVDRWQATTEPGRHYTLNPMNPAGAARIKFGQYKAWAIGTHGNAEPHEALIQIAPITVHRDFNKDFKRTGDKEDTGLFGINQHHGYDLPENNVKNASAGCLVGRSRVGHRAFMKIIKQDHRYQLNPNYIFYTTIIPGDELCEFAQI